MATRRALEPGARVVPLDRGEKADLAEVDREHGDAGAGVAAQRGQDRAVAAEGEADVDVEAAVDVYLETRAVLEPVLTGLLGIDV